MPRSRGLASAAICLGRYKFGQSTRLRDAPYVSLPRPLLAVLQPVANSQVRCQSWVLLKAFRRLLKDASGRSRAYRPLPGTEPKSNTAKRKNCEVVKSWPDARLALSLGNHQRRLDLPWSGHCWSGDSSNGLIRPDTLSTLRVDRSGYVVIRNSTLHRLVCVAGIGDETGVELRISAA